MERKEEGGDGQAVALRDATLFQRQASLSTARLRWRGEEDRRVPLSVVAEENVPAQRNQSAAVFINFTPHSDLLQSWAESRVWYGPLVRHGRTCACCVNPFDIDQLLAKIFRDRATGQCCFFTQVFLICEKNVINEVCDMVVQSRVVSGMYGLKDSL